MAMFNILYRQKWYIHQQSSIITVITSLFPLMAGGENICEINALFDALKSQRKE